MRAMKEWHLLGSTELVLQVLKRAGPRPWHRRRAPPVLNGMLLLGAVPEHARKAAWLDHVCTWLCMGVRLQQASLHAAAEAMLAMLPSH